MVRQKLETKLDLIRSFQCKLSSSIIQSEYGLFLCEFSFDFLMGIEQEKLYNCMSTHYDKKKRL
jgi:hypothetical protein